ncbi:MAG: hypothetical protein ACE5EE_05425 [Fidelibacterota bacterium]
MFLRQMAEKTIGVDCSDNTEEKSLRFILNCWLNQLDLIEEQAR